MNLWTHMDFWEETASIFSVPLWNLQGIRAYLILAQQHKQGYQQEKQC